MPISDLFKRLTSPDKYTQSSISIMDANSATGGKQPAFDQRLAVRSFESWVYAAATINAYACAATPLRLYVRKRRGTKLFGTRKPPAHRKRYLLGDGGGGVQPSARTIRKLMEIGEDFEEVTEAHPLVDLLNNVNPVDNGFDLTTMRILYGELTGNAYHAVIFDPVLGVPTQLWTMPSQWTYVMPDQNEFIKGYSYSNPMNEAIEFGRDEVIHFRRPNPDDLFYGKGKVEAAWGTIGINKAIHEMDASMFRNHARPDYAVVVKGPSGDSTLKRFEEHVSQQLQGTRKAGKFLAMTGDVTLTPLNFPPKDLSGREEVVEEIAAVFGVPVSLLKANDPNLASAKSGYAQWREGTILPLLRMDEDELNQSLIPMFGLEGDACLCYDNPVPRDEVFELSKMQAAVGGGWMTINEARISEGREPFEDELADQPLVGGQPLGGAPAMPGFMSEDAPEDDETATTGEVLDNADSVGVSVRSDPSAPEKAAMTGPQLAAALKVAQAVSDGSLAPEAAAGLLGAAGLAPDVALQIAASQTKQEEEEEEDDYKADETEATNYYSTPEEAEAAAELIGCSGFHTMTDPEGSTLYMPCESHGEYDEATAAKAKCGCNGTSVTDQFEGSPDAKVYLPWDIKGIEPPANMPNEAEYIRNAAKFAAVIDNNMRQAVNEVIEQLKNTPGMTKADLNALLREKLGDSFKSKMAAATTAHVRMATENGIKLGTHQLEGLADMTGTQVEAAARQHLEKVVSRTTVRLANDIGNTVSHRLKDIIGDGIEKGEGVRELGARVQDWAGERGDVSRGTRARAETIARTESARAVIEGQIETFEATGVVSEKKWLLAPHACQFCSKMKGKRIKLRDDFAKSGDTLTGADGGTMKLDYGDTKGPPLHPNCRCALTPVLER